MSIRISKYSFNYILLLVLTILPSWFEIRGHIATSVVSFCMFVLIIFSIRKVDLQYVKESKIIWIWLCIRDIIYALHGEYMRMITLTIMVLLIAIVCRQCINNKDSFIHALDTFIYFSFIVCIFGIIEAIVGNNIFLLLNNSGNVIMRNEERLGIMRIIGFTTQTTHYAIYAAMTSLITLYRIEISYRKNRRIAFYCIYLFQLMNIIFTLSRTAIICYAIIIFIFFIKKGVKKFVRNISIAIIIVLLLIFLWGETFIGKTVIMALGAIIPGLSHMVTGVASAEANNAFGDRLKLYSWVFNSVKNNFIIGVGEKTNFNQEITIKNSLYTYNAIKNSIEVHYLYCLFHFGIVGMVSEIYLYMGNLINSFKAIRVHKIFENKISFEFTIFIIILFNIIAMFGIMQGEEMYTLYLLLFIWINYRKIEA